MRLQYAHIEAIRTLAALMAAGAVAGALVAWIRGEPDDG